MDLNSFYTSFKEDYETLIPEAEREVPPDDLAVLSSFFCDSFHTIHSGLLRDGFVCARAAELDGKEREFRYSHPRRPTSILLRYTRHRRGVYYCHRVEINGHRRKIADVMEML